ncbi:phosphate-starvation-inducible protein PsiE [Burkholderia gladioli]|uniref:Protein PsiE n=5 Tax=Burkholderia TaxID=32008 RepID=A0A095VZ81_BURGA|nr:phosphate-starvation-inducible PsiE family protein [Burkholderia gladioli]AEA61319.1 Phosphate-starvation-inducible E [Burkholderia gladioli BSR3]NBI50668.1 phosphate-starvation-inducible E [Burkholderia sp. ISTR5]ASD80117.1 phosphate-starvation-inducible E [Burkholderia gladioli pv. gladioli]ATF83701.1 phosphate-starvation-inducible E [Burkholderia gladioli pv. gladioli]AWY54634.1 phosphate-starvation-inducible E [Burkholderia gladioli pv. gladioli]
MLRERLESHLKWLMEICEMLGLIVIGLGTAIALANLVWSVIRTEQVTLTDLLLMFLFLEVFAMVSQYLKSGQLPVRFPLYIAIGSIARDIILRAATNTEAHLLASALAVVLMAIGVLVIRYGQCKFPGQSSERKLDEMA